jgi:hypothetical protein
MDAGAEAGAPEDCCAGPPADSVEDPQPVNASPSDARTIPDFKVRAEHFIEAPRQGPPGEQTAFKLGFPSYFPGDR